MTGALHLTITTPASVLADITDARAIRAEDDSGSFGILPGHADLLTVLPVSVVRWTGPDGSARYCALRGGVFSMSGGDRVGIACRQGVLGDDLAMLERDVAAARSAETEADRKARVEQLRLHAQAVRQVMHNLLPGAGSMPFAALDQEAAQ